jgi:hypothetical protein
MEYTYDYDDNGVRVRFSEENGWEALEPHCLNCGCREEECDCEEYEEAEWVEDENDNEEDDEPKKFDCPGFEKCA